MQFSERTPIEEGFSAVFEADVKPPLTELEFDRQAVVRRTRILSALWIAASVAMGFLLFYWVGDEEGPLVPILISVIAGYVSYVVVNMRAALRWGSNVEDIVMSAVCLHLSDLTYSESGDSFSVDTMVDMKLVPNTHYKRRSSLLRGSHHGTRFSMVHARFTGQDRSSRRDLVNNPGLFKGLLFQVALPHPSPGRIALIRDRGHVGNKLAEALSFGGVRSMPKVAVNQADLEEVFEVYAEDPEGAKAFLTDTLVKIMLRIGYDNGPKQGAKSFTAGFDGSTLYLALRREKAFTMVGDLWTPVGEIEDDLHGVFEDITFIYNVIDNLNHAFGEADAAP